MTVIRMLLTLLVVHAESSLDLLSDGLHLDDWWYDRFLELGQEQCQSMERTGWHGKACVYLCYRYRYGKSLNVDGLEVGRM